MQICFFRGLTRDNESSAPSILYDLVAPATQVVAHTAAWLPPEEMKLIGTEGMLRVPTIAARRVQAFSVLVSLFLCAGYVDAVSMQHQQKAAHMLSHLVLSLRCV